MKFALAVFDSLADFLALVGLNENDAGDVTRWVKEVAQPLKDAGVAVLSLDHLTKSTEGRGRYARGSGAKLAKVDVSWSLTQTKPFDKERIGEIQLDLRKDRDAYLPARQQFEVGGEDSKLVFRRSGTSEESSQEDLTASARKALAVLEAKFRQDGARYMEWMRAADIPKTTFRRARDDLVKVGKVVQDGNRYRPAPTRDPRPPDKGTQGPRPQDGPNGPTVGQGATGATTLKGGPNGPNLALGADSRIVEALRQRFADDPHTREEDPANLALDLLHMGYLDREPLVGEVMVAIASLKEEEIAV
jgi:hypothetical protein